MAGTLGCGLGPGKFSGGPSLSSGDQVARHRLQRAGSRGGMRSHLGARCREIGLFAAGHHQGGSPWAQHFAGVRTGTTLADHSLMVCPPRQRQQPGKGQTPGPGARGRQAGCVQLMAASALSDLVRVGDAFGGLAAPRHRRRPVPRLPRSCAHPGWPDGRAARRWCRRGEWRLFNQQHVAGIEPRVHFGMVMPVLGRPLQWAVVWGPHASGAAASREC